jgi:hypothetical protein
MPNFFRKSSSARQSDLLRADRRFKFDKRSLLFIRVHNETLSVIAVCVCNPDRFVIKRCPGPE